MNEFGYVLPEQNHTKIEECFTHERLGFTYEFLKHAPRSLVIQDGPFIYLIGETKDACYEVYWDDFLRRSKDAKRIRIIDKVSMQAPATKGRAE